MRNRCRFDARMMLVAPALAALLVACGGGDRPQDEVPNRVAPAPAAASGPDSSLAPNPLVQPDGTLQSNTLAYAEAYYAAIDPGGPKDTLDKWKAANRFGQTGGIEVSAMFGDFRDLGYGSRMTGRRVTDDKTIAFVVENYLVNPSGDAYGDAINLDAAIVDDRQWRVSINAIEYSPGPGGTIRYAKFYSFDPPGRCATPDPEPRRPRREGAARSVRCAVTVAASTRWSRPSRHLQAPVPAAAGLRARATRRRAAGCTCSRSTG